jgi:glc operon protein GlcG
MYSKPNLGLDEARKAVDAILDAAMKEPARPIAVAAFDDDGKLVVFARMDGARPLPQMLAQKKAYTAAVMRTDTAAFAERMSQQGRSVSDLGDPNLTAVQGGLPVQASDGTPLGGIGVSGLRADEDEALSRVGIQAMGL